MMNEQTQQEDRPAMRHLISRICDYTGLSTILACPDSFDGALKAIEHDFRTSYPFEPDIALQEMARRPKLNLEVLHDRTGRLAVVEIWEQAEDPLSVRAAYRVRSVEMDFQSAGGV